MLLAFRRICFNVFIRYNINGNQGDFILLAGDDQKLVDALREAASGTQHRSQTARLRNVFDEVQQTFQRGLSRRGLLEVLHGHGFKFTYRSLGVAIYRIRKERIAGAASSSTPRQSVLMPPPPAQVSVSHSPAPAPRTISNPTDLIRSRNRPINLKDLKS